MKVYLALLAACASCTGVVAGSVPGSAGGGGPTQTELCITNDKPATTRVRRLTKVGIQNAASVVLARDATSLLSNLDADSQINGGFANDDQLVVSESFANSLNLAADTIGAQFKATLTKTSFDSTCFASDGAAETCAETFIQSFGKKAFRRNITDADVAGLIVVYDAGREVGIDGDVSDRFATGLSWIVRAVVQSPDFIYLTELGDAGIANGVSTPLLADEAANAISFSVLGMPPDEALTTAANQNELQTPDQRAAQVNRLIATYPDHWKQQMRLFVLQWLGINFSKPEWQKNPAVLPMFSTSLKTAIETETNMFVDDWANESRLDTLLTTPSTFVNEVNAPLYGVTASGMAFRKIALDSSRRAGILTLAGFLGSTSHVAETSPVIRGKVILEKFLCREPPPPPPNVPPLPPIDQSVPSTTRARFDAHLVNPVCSDCHSAFQPMGEAFEEYDALGVFRTQQNGFAIDSSGALVGTRDGDQPVANAVELANLLARSPDALDCVARQAFRFTLGRMDAPYDKCTLGQARKMLNQSQFDVRELMSSIVSSNSFVLRTVTQ